MYSVTMYIGLSLLHTPYNWTKFWCWSFLNKKQRYLSFNHMNLSRLLYAWILFIDLRHHFSFFYKIVLGHSAFLHHLNSNVYGAAPLSSSHDTELSGAEFLQQMQLCRIDLPFICRGNGCIRLYSYIWLRVQLIFDSKMITNHGWDQLSAVQGDRRG